MGISQGFVLRFTGSFSNIEMLTVDHVGVPTEEMLKLEGNGARLNEVSELGPEILELHLTYGFPGHEGYFISPTVGIEQLENFFAYLGRRLGNFCIDSSPDFSFQDKAEELIRNDPLWPVISEYWVQQ